MEKRLLLAVALSILIIITFQYLGPKPAKQPQPQKTAEVVAMSTPAKVPEISAPTITAIPAEEKELNVETDKYIITFSNIGGSIKRIQLKDYKNLSYSELLELASIKNPKEYIFAMTSTLSPATLDLAAYEITRKDNEVIYFLKTDGLEITKSYILHNSKYIIELHITIKNISGSHTPRPFSYYVVGGSSLKEADGQDKRFVEADAKLDNKISRLKIPKTGRVTTIGMVDWVALKSKYFSLILKPFIETKGLFCSESTAKDIVTGIESTTTDLVPTQISGIGSQEGKFILYAGPSRISDLKEAGCGLEESVNYGVFGGIVKAMIVVMHFFYAIVHSWGVSIILLAIFLNIILFPLTIKSFKSMQKMQELHPQMEKLKKEYKDNPQKLNKEIMELYKKYKINPLSGCLPMLLQMPVFFALYQALMKSIELRGTKFLWIKDLSSPDAIRMPFELPVIGATIHLLPLIMVAAMVFQQKLSTKTMGAAITEEQKQQQKMMLVMMPIMFGLIFYNMPSGLVIYWIVNTILTIVEQGAMLKKD